MKRRFSENKAWAALLPLVIVVLPALYGALSLLLFPTSEQRSLEKENRALGSEIPVMAQKLDSLEIELEALKGRDAEIFRKIFNSEPPSPRDIVPQAGLPCSERIDRCFLSAARIEEKWRAINDSLLSRRYFLPPLISPVDGLVHGLVGASTGIRINPFYKVGLSHEGLDILSGESTLVFSTCRGWVSAVQRSRGGKGNMVEISHPGGYLTRYSHLQDIFVSAGDYVDAHRCIGTVGSSGRSFAAHLHYEVGTEISVFDPCQHLFGSVGPEEYCKILITSESSGQSLD